MHMDRFCHKGYSNNQWRLLAYGVSYQKVKSRFWDFYWSGRFVWCLFRGVSVWPLYFLLSAAAWRAVAHTVPPRMSSFSLPSVPLPCFLQSPAESPSKAPPLWVTPSCTLLTEHGTFLCWPHWHPLFPTGCSPNTLPITFPLQVHSSCLFPHTDAWPSPWAHPASVYPPSVIFLENVYSIRFYSNSTSSLWLFLAFWKNKLLSYLCFQVFMHFLLWPWSHSWRVIYFTSVPYHDLLEYLSLGIPGLQLRELGIHLHN